MPVEGSETLRVVLGCGFCGIVGDVNGPVVRDKARFGRGWCGGPCRWPSTEGLRATPVGKVT